MGYEIDVKGAALPGSVRVPETGKPRLFRRVFSDLRQRIDSFRRPPERSALFDPDVVRSQVEQSFSQGDMPRALEDIEAALKLMPRDRALLTWQAKALLRSGQPEEAAACLAALLERFPDNPDLLLTRARALRSCGDLLAAETLCQQVLSRHPKNRRAHLSLIDTALSSGDVDAAMRYCTAAEGLLPNDPSVRKKQADLLRRMGRGADALSILGPLVEQYPQRVGILMAFARAHVVVQAFADAEDAFRQVLDMQPDHMEALIAQANLSARLGDPAAGLRVLERGSTTGVPAADLSRPGLALKYVELSIKAGDVERLQIGLSAVEACLPKMNVSQLQRLAAIAPRAGRADMMACALSGVTKHDQLAVSAAMLVLRQAHACGDSRVTSKLRGILASRIRGSDRLSFLVKSTRLCCGPDQALADLRLALPSRRIAGQAVLLGEALLAAKLGEITRRYLQYCQRKWPGVVTFRTMLIRACIDTGQYEQACFEIERCQKEAPDVDLDRFRTLVGMYVSVADRPALPKPGRRKPMTAGGTNVSRLVEALRAGRLEEAEDIFAQMKANPLQGAWEIARFQSMWSFGLLAELRQYRSAVDAPGTREAITPLLVRTNFFAAKHVVETWIDEQRDRNAPSGFAGAAIPKRIFQHWNPAELPAEVAPLMKSWRSVPGYQHDRIDLDRARAFLRDRFGPEHLRAFDTAANYAEGSDFLRLCLILAEGGFYTDADNRLTGNLDAMLGGAGGMVLFHEPPNDPVGNHAFAAPPGHRLLEIAVDLCLKPLLAGEQTNTWFKTGPGLLTRATAAYLLETAAEEGVPELRILPVQDMSRHMSRHIHLSYKSSGEYWQGKDTTPAAVKVVLEQLIAA